MKLKFWCLLLMTVYTLFVAAQNTNVRGSLLLSFKRGSKVQFIYPVASGKLPAVSAVESPLFSEYAVAFPLVFEDLINFGRKQLTVIFEVKKKTDFRALKFALLGNTDVKSEKTSDPFGRFGKFAVCLTDVTLNGSMLTEKSESYPGIGEFLVFGTGNNDFPGVKLQPGKRYVLRGNLRCKTDFTAIGALKLNITEPGAVEICNAGGNSVLDKPGRNLQLSGTYPANSIALGGKCRLKCRIKAQKNCRFSGASFETLRYAGSCFTGRHYYSMLKSLSVNGKNILTAPQKGNWRGEQPIRDFSLKLKAGKTYSIDAELIMPSTDVYSVAFQFRTPAMATFNTRGINFSSYRIKNGVMYQASAQIDRALLMSGGQKALNFVLVPEKNMIIDGMWFEINHGIGGVKQNFCPGSLILFTVNGLNVLNNPVEIYAPAKAGAMILDDKLILEAKREYNVQLVFEFETLI